jgi:hypothetical protein
LHLTQFQKLRSELLTLLRAPQCGARSLWIGIIAEHRAVPGDPEDVAENIERTCGLGE